MEVDEIATEGEGDERGWAKWRKVGKNKMVVDEKNEKRQRKMLGGWCRNGTIESSA